ncbi:hypothetical protein B5M45_30570 [Mycobacterium simiae]|uniref:Antitoxin MazE7 n=2 Tax=Mycobacterium simiae complex TaxID=2249310 RepID=A0A1X0XIJ4_MYCSI|nr:hypothetical protein B5M45_30570 [Mycobacterium simiae]
MWTADVTTIKVTKPLRDRITAATAQRHQTLQSFVEHVMDEHDRSRRLAAFATALSSADEDSLRGWRDEADSWSAPDSDLDGVR